jgi:hypothetical protein
MPGRTSDLDLRLDGIAHVLRDRLLAVPPYQRPYSWGSEQVQAFWDDLRAALVVSDPEYFMGTIVLSTEEAPRLTVIDGQQRLVTASLLLAAIRDALLEANDSQRAAVLERDYLISSDLRSGNRNPRLILTDQDAPFFEGIVSRSGQGSPNGTKSNERLADAYNLLTNELKNEIYQAGPHWADRLFDWVDFLDQRVQVITIRVANDVDAFQIFETLNDRGLDLTIADLLKNYLLSLARNDIDELQTEWSQILRAFTIERDEQTVTVFIRHYWNSLYGPTRERELYKSLKRRVRSDVQAIDLVNELSHAAPYYGALLDSAHYQWAELQVPPPIAETLLRLELEQNRPLLLAAMEKFEPPELVKVLLGAINWSVRGLLVGGIGGGTTERYYSLAAINVRSGKSRDAQAVFKDLTPIVPTDDAFMTAVAQRRILRPRLARYYLLAFNQRYMNDSQAAIVADEIFEQFAVAYVLPRRATEDKWPAFSDGTLSQEALRLGNQVLLRKGQTFPDDDWPARRHVLLNSGIELSRRAGEKSVWSPIAISALQDDMALSAPEIWPREP